MALMPDRDDPGITFASVLILALLGAFFWTSAPLESARPTPQEGAAVEQPADQRVAARLWQDPFSTVQRHQERSGFLAEGPDVQAELKGALAETSGVPPEGDLAVLAVMLSPGRYAEIEERRRRRRYAVLAGVAEAGFVPQDAEAPRDLRDGLSQAGSGATRQLLAEGVDAPVYSPGPEPTGVTDPTPYTANAPLCGSHTSGSVTRTNQAQSPVTARFWCSGSMSPGSRGNPLTVSKA